MRLPSPDKSGLAMTDWLFPPARPEHVEGPFMVRQACPELAEGLTTNGVRDVNSHVWRVANHRQESAAKKAFSFSVVPISIGMFDCEPKVMQSNLFPPTRLEMFYCPDLSGKSPPPQLEGVALPLLWLRIPRRDRSHDATL